MTGNEPRKLTGRGVAVIFGTFFAVILAANITMLVNAVGTFSGLVVPNSYVASQSFDRDRSAQQALGWTLDLTYANNELTISINDSGNNMVRPDVITAVVGRPTTERNDQILTLRPGPEGYIAPAELAHGSWRVDIRATASDGTVFVQQRSLFVRNPG